MDETKKDDLHAADGSDTIKIGARLFTKVNR